MNRHKIPRSSLLHEKELTDAEYEFARNFSDTVWHPITPEELNQIYDKFRGDSDLPKFFKALGKLLVTYIIILLIWLLITFGFFGKKIFIACLITATVVEAVMFLRELKLSKNLLSADICYMPVYYTYKRVDKREGAPDKIRFLAVAFYGMKKYIYEIKEKDRQITDFMVINVENTSVIRPVMRPENMLGKRAYIKRSGIDDEKPE